MPQVTSQRIEHAASEPQNWLTYGGTYSGQRYSTLTQINQANVKDLEQKWMVQDQVPGAWESNPLVVDGIMYLTERPNDVMAVDARTGKLFWLYRWTPDPGARVCCGSQNRGVAILGDTLYVGTLDAHLIALDSKTGKPIWNTTVADFKDGLFGDHGALDCAGQSHSGRRRAASSAFAALLRHSIPRRERRSGASIPFLAPGDPASTAGKATTGRPAAGRSGPWVPLIPP